MILVGYYKKEMIETKAMVRGFRHVPQYDDMFAEIFKKTPARAPDRTAAV